MFAPGFDASFEREYGCTESEWLYWLPGAVGEHPLTQTTAGQASVAVAGGRLRLGWTVLAPRRIALLSMPRLAVRFAFEAVDPGPGAAFMRYFDLYMQRGGG